MTKEAWQKRKEKYGISGCKNNQKRIEKLKCNPNIGCNTQAYFDNIKKTGIIPKNEKIRRKKIIIGNKNREFTWGDKIGKTLLGNKNCQGRILSQHTKDLISKSTSKSIQKKIKEEGFHWGMKNKHHTEESKLKDAISHLGEKSSLWQGGKSYEPYTKEWNNILKKEIRKRDNNVCQLCMKFGKDVHHIDYDKKNCNNDNLITLCRRCHIKTNLKREYWQKILIEKNKTNN
jgi:hypothetical protein